MKAFAIEDAFAAAVGQEAVAELARIRGKSDFEFNRFGELAPEGYRWDMNDKAVPITPGASQNDVNQSMKTNVTHTSDQDNDDLKEGETEITFIPTYKPEKQNASTSNKQYHGGDGGRQGGGTNHQVRNSGAAGNGEQNKVEASVFVPPDMSTASATDEGIAGVLKRLALVDELIRLEVQEKNKGNNGKAGLEGWDTSSSEAYPLEGEYPNEESARAAAHERLLELEESQPTATSGGQYGIQDQVYIYGPDGSGYRYRE